MTVAQGSPGRLGHHPGPTKGRQLNGITTHLEQISDGVAARGTQAVLEHRGGQCGQRVGATAVKLQGWRAPAVSPGHVSHGLQRPQEPPWPRSWGLGEVPSRGRTTLRGPLLLLPLSCPGPPSSLQGPPRRPHVPRVGLPGPSAPPAPGSGPGLSLGAPAPGPAAPSHGRSSPRPWRCWRRRPLWPAARPGHRTVSHPWRSGERGAYSAGGLSPHKTCLHLARLDSQDGPAHLELGGGSAFHSAAMPPPPGSPLWLPT